MCDSEIRVEQIHINQGVAVKLKENIVKNFLKILGSMCHGVQFKLLPARNKWRKFSFSVVLTTVYYSSSVVENQSRWEELTKKVICSLSKTSVKSICTSN